MHFPPDVRALHDVSFDVAPGSSLAVMGPSGSGKTTLLNVMGLMEPPTAGTYVLGGRETTRLGEGRRSALRGSSIGFVFQAFHLVPHLTVLENVLMPSRYSRARPRQAVASRAHALVHALGLTTRMDAKPATLSGGEKQRTAIARALLTDPVLLLCDEPTGSLDTETGTRVLDLLLDLGRTSRRGLVIVTHDPDVASRADTTVRMRDGQLR